MGTGFCRGAHMHSFCKGGPHAWALVSVEVGHRMSTGFCKGEPGAWELFSVKVGQANGHWIL